MTARPKTRAVLGSKQAGLGSNQPVMMTRNQIRQLGVNQSTLDNILNIAPSSGTRTKQKKNKRFFPRDAEVLAKEKTPQASTHPSTHTSRVPSAHPSTHTSRVPSAHPSTHTSRVPSAHTSTHTSRASSPPGTSGKKKGKKGKQKKQRKQRTRLTVGERKFNMLKKYSNMERYGLPGTYQLNVERKDNKHGLLYQYFFSANGNEGKGQWSMAISDANGNRKIKIKRKPRCVKINKPKRIRKWGKSRIIGPFITPESYQ